MEDNRRIVTMNDGTKGVIDIITSFNYEKNNNNYLVYKVVGSDYVLLSRFNIVDDIMVLEETTPEENREIEPLLKEITVGGNA